MITNPEESCTERPWHILRSVKGESVPSRVLAFQIEPQIRLLDGTVHEHRFRVGTGVCYWLVDGQVVDQEEDVFRRPEDWFRWLRLRRSRDRCTWISSYGLAYGLTLLDWWRTALHHGEELVSAVTSDPPTIIVTRCGKRISRYIDMANYSRDGLRTLMRRAGAVPTSSSYYCPDDETAMCRSRIKTQFVGDYLCRAINLVRSNRLCSWQPTAASLSFTTYRHSCMSTPLWIHAHPEAFALERAALFGGRVQTWRDGYVNEPIKICDVNSLYPYVMRDYVHPVKFRSYQHGASLRELSQALRGFECVAKVTVASCSPHLPRRMGAHLYWDGTAGIRPLAGPELRQAHALGCIERVHQLSRYDAGVPFASFVRSLYPLKLSLSDKGDQLGASFVKLLLNSLVGKFSQKGKRWKNVPQAPSRGHWSTWLAKHPQKDHYCMYRDLGGLVQCVEEGGEWRHSFPALSASVTSAARIELARHIDTAGAAATLYCDTDSVHCLREGYDRLVAGGHIHPTRLGSLKIAHEGPDGTYWGLKHYRVGDKYCCCFLTASAVGIAEGVYRDAARYHFEHMMSAGMTDRWYGKDRLVKMREHSSAERMEVINYEESG